MTLSRRPILLLVVLALLGTACSRFAPKAGVGIKPVGIDLAFGVDVDEIVESPTPSTGPTGIITFPTPTDTFTPPPPPIPEPDLCPPPKNLNIRDGEAPRTMVDRREFVPDSTSGGRPRRGDYLAYFEGNLSGEAPRSQIGYINVSRPATSDANGNFNYDVSELFSQIKWKMAIVYSTTDEGRANDEVAGIYLQGIEVPYRPDGNNTGTRSFIMNGNGAKITPFPIEPGNRTVSTVPIPTNSSQINPPDPNDPQTDVPTFSGSTVLTLTSTVQSLDNRVFVCDKTASAWIINMTIEIEGETELTLNGNFWFAPQYGGWAIRQSYSIQGGSDFISGNIFETIMRLDPKDPV